MFSRHRRGDAGFVFTATPDGAFDYTSPIATCNEVLDAAYVQRHRGVAPGDYVCIDASDSGEGMSADVVARACEPFFTTKPIGQGIGLGLPMVYGFTRQSAGRTRIQSVPGQGTIVELYLPRRPGETDALTEANATPTPRAVCGRS